MLTRRDMIRSGVVGLIPAGIAGAGEPPRPPRHFIARGRTLGMPSGPGGEPWAIVAMSPRGGTVAGSLGGSLRVWDFDTGNRLLDEPLAHPLGITGLAVGPDDYSHEPTQIAIAGYGRLADAQEFARGAPRRAGAALGIWNLKRLGTPELTLAPRSLGLPMFPGGYGRVASLGDGLQVWDIQHGTEVVSLSGGPGVADALALGIEVTAAFDPQGYHERAVAISNRVQVGDHPLEFEGGLVHWNYEDKLARYVRYTKFSALKAAGLQDDAPQCLTIEWQDGLVLTVGPRHQIEAWSLNDEEPLRVQGMEPALAPKPDYERGPTCVAARPDGARWVTGSRDGLLRVWSTVDRRLIRVYHGPKVPVRAVAFVPKSTKVRVVSGGTSGPPDDKGVRPVYPITAWEVDLGPRPEPIWLPILP